MRILSSLALAAALTVPSFGQIWNRGPYNDRGPYQGRNGGDAAYRELDRVEQDLRSVASRGGWFGNSGSRRSVDRALNDVGHVRNDWQRKGRINTGKVDSAIRHLSDAMRERRLDGRDRQMISRDIGILQSLRNGGGYPGGPRW